MKIFIFTYDRFNTISTSAYFKGLPHTVLCHTEEQKAAFLAGGRIYTPDLVATGAPRGLAYNRNFALSQMQAGEWALFFVDDLIRMTYLDGYEAVNSDTIPVDSASSTAEFRKKFKKECSAETFLQICEQEILHAEQLKMALVGFSLTDNPLFRRKKYAHWCLADGRCWLVKKTHLKFDNNVQLIDDTCWTAKNLEAFGGVVVNNWVLPECERYSAGAFGSIEQRMPQKLQECEYLVRKYPGYIDYADKAGWPKGSHVRIVSRARPRT